MSFFQHHSGVTDRYTSPTGTPELPIAEWGVDRLADQVTELDLVSDLPDRQSPSKREATTLKRSSRAIGSKLRRETTLPNTYTPSSPPAKVQHIPQHSYSVDYQASQGHNRVYEPPPSHKELVESDSRIMEVQQEAGPLPLLLNSYPKQYNNEEDEQSLLEKSILKKLHPTFEDHDEKTIEETVYYASPTNGSYAYSPGSPSLNGVFQHSNGTSSSVNEYDQPFSSPPISQPNGNAGTLNAVMGTTSYTDNNKSSHQNHYVMLPIGRTGHGKSSLLNSMLGYPEFKASNSVQRVTDAVTERSAIWKVDKKRNLVTVADTPGFADPNRQDPEWKALIKEYIVSVGRRFGIDAFMLTFRLGASADVFFKIVQEFVDMMGDLKPKTWWDHVLFVFTRNDYEIHKSQQTTAEKMLIVGPFMDKLVKQYNLSKTPQVIFLGTQQPVCGYARGLQCDCVEATRHLLDGQRRLLRAISSKSALGRWHYEEPDDIEDDEEEENTSSGYTATTNYSNGRQSGDFSRQLERRQTTKQHTDTVIRNLRQNGP
ncbi:hypothetical protein INT43_003170 [Umbelopsis isabellina]|uniref:AIG1-type G domain-containing protein n=1 Tax=Mortierella isabellina TaxID=91625 RepID=A0A8H7UFG0_MORIS|nr:hypothetical protein INT43_003170 [Umbelopsis isabellina]